MAVDRERRRSLRFWIHPSAAKEVRPVESRMTSWTWRRMALHSATEMPSCYVFGKTVFGSPVFTV